MNIEMFELFASVGIGGFIAYEVFQMNGTLNKYGEKHTNHEKRLDNHEGRIQSLEDKVD